MGKELKDYVKYYLGCQVVYHGVQKGWTAEICKVLNGGAFVAINIYDDNAHMREDGLIARTENLKLLLRPLSYLREDELRNAVDPMAYGLSSLRGDNALLQAAEMTHYLVSKYYDVFGLIAAGLALDITKINTDGK